MQETCDMHKCKRTSYQPAISIYSRCTFLKDNHTLTSLFLFYSQSQGSNPRLCTYRTSALLLNYIPSFFFSPFYHTSHIHLYQKHWISFSKSLPRLHRSNQHPLGISVIADPEVQKHQFIHCLGEKNMRDRLGTSQRNICMQSVLSLSTWSPICATLSEFFTRCPKLVSFLGVLMGLSTAIRVHGSLYLLVNGPYLML